MLGVTYWEIFLLGKLYDSCMLFTRFLSASKTRYTSHSMHTFLYSMVRFPHGTIRFSSDPARFSFLRQPISFLCPLYVVQCGLYSFSSPAPTVKVSFPAHLLAVRPAVCKLFIFFLFLQKHGAKFNPTQCKASLSEGDLKFIKEGLTLSKREIIAKQ